MLTTQPGTNSGAAVESSNPLFGHGDGLWPYWIVDGRNSKAGGLAIVVGHEMNRALCKYHMAHTITMALISKDELSEAIDAALGMRSPVFIFLSQTFELAAHESLITKVRAQCPKQISCWAVRSAQNGSAADPLFERLLAHLHSGRVKITHAIHHPESPISAYEVSAICFWANLTDLLYAGDESHRLAIRNKWFSDRNDPRHSGVSLTFCAPYPRPGTGQPPELAIHRKILTGHSPEGQLHFGFTDLEEFLVLQTTGKELFDDRIGREPDMDDYPPESDDFVAAAKDWCLRRDEVLAGRMHVWIFHFQGFNERYRLGPRRLGT